MSVAPSAYAQAPFEILHEFSGYDRAQGPNAPLVEGTDGNFYGTTRERGRFNRGTIFRLTPSGALTILYEFAGGESDGKLPVGPLIQAHDGNFYGVTEYGGIGSASCDLCGRGVLFKMTPAGAVTILHAFVVGSSDGGHPGGGLVEASDGRLYGTTLYGGTSNYGTVFAVSTDGVVTVLHSFAGGPIEGARPNGSLAQGRDGNFYGTTRYGGQYANCGDCGYGTVFSVNPSGTLTTHDSFTGAASNGRWPYASVIQAADGAFYGTAFSGAPGSGVVFRLMPGIGLTFLHSFNGPVEGDGHEAVFMQASDGNFYAGTSGRVIRMNSSGVVTVLHTFSGGEGGGGQVPGLIQARDGNLYGTTAGGGVSGTNFGTIFKMDLTGAVTILYRFSGSVEGFGPAAGLVRAHDGNFYGTTEFGGIFNHGTIFRMTPAGATSVVYTFAAGYDGGYPRGALVQANDGHLYGTTPRFGAFDAGIIFRFALDGTFTILHAFNAGLDAAVPNGGLIQGTDGYLYGTSLRGGPFQRGTVFRSTLDGEVTVLHAFAGGSADGADPTTPLIQASDGNFYGTTMQGGSTVRVYPGLDGAGIVFRMTPAGGYSIVHRFDGVTDGANPNGGLVEGPDGHFYGVTACGGSPGGGLTFGGSFFRLSAAGSVTVLSQAGIYCDDDLPFPIVTLARGRDGRLYGTMSAPSQAGSFAGLFAMNLDGAKTWLHIFSGQHPIGSLVQDVDGRFYGTTAGGGAFEAGVVYRTTPVALAPATVLRTTSNQGEVRLRWTPIANAIGYTIKRATTAGAEIVLASGVTTANYVDTSTTPGQRYHYVVTAVNEFGESVASYEVSITAGQATVGDFNGDGVAEAAVFRPSTGTWYVRGVTTTVWGGGTDVPVPGDYDGDMRADIAVYRPSTGVWYLVPSSMGLGSAVTWGGGDDVPVPGDYDGDGTTDVAVYRPSTGEWFILQSSTQTGRVVVWGGGADVPVARDFDGDGTTDVTVFRPSTGDWFILQSSTQTGSVTTWGGGADVPVAADYDGDGKADLSVFRPSTGTWFILQSRTRLGSTTLLGAGTDVPVPADYDGDGKTDITVFRPSIGRWFINQSSTAMGSSITWGGGADIPVLKP